MTDKAGDPPSLRFTSGRLAAKNVVWNLIGQGFPMLVAIFAIPLLIKGLGVDRFGVLTLAWMVIGYFSLFDLGLGRALTKLVAEKLGAGQDEEIPALVYTTMLLMLGLGVLGTGVLGLLSPWLVYHVLKVPEPLQSETLQAFYLLAFSIPVVISATGFRGILEAQQRFGFTNAVRIVMGVFTFLGPLLVLPFSNHLFPVVGILLVIRFITFLMYLLLCFYTMPALRQGILLKRTAIGPLLRFGGWMTVTNIVGPLMTYLDRFLIGAIVSVTAVAYYATPYEVVGNMGVIPSAVVGVLFPAFAANFGTNPGRARLFFGWGVKYTFLALFPLTLVIVIFAREGLALWLGGEFADNSLHVLRWLAFGRFLNGLAQIPFAFVQGVGHPDLTAKLHLIELPFYLFAVWWLTGLYGIEGAAIAWVARVVVDTLFLFGMAQRLLPYKRAVIWRTAFVMGGALSALAASVFLTGLAVKGVFLSLALLVFVVFTWRCLLDRENKQMLFSILGRSSPVVGASK